MKVVFTVGSLDPVDGGPSRTVPALCESLLKAGVQAAIVTCAVDVRAGRPLLSVPVQEVRYRNRLLRAVWGAPFRRELNQCAREGRADIIHDNGLWLQTNHAAATVAGRLSLPLVVSPRGMLEPWSMTQGAVKKNLAWRAFQRGDLESAVLLHATSTMEADNLRQIGLRQPITIIPNGIQMDAIDDARTLRTGSRTRIALFLSRIHPKKGLFDLVAAWARLRPAGWRVVVAGPDEGGHKAAVIAAARDAGVGDLFDFVGAVEGERKRQLFHDADLFVLPTASENFGVVVAEALAAGLPVVTTKGTPWNELETEGCGWWTSLGVDPLVDALQVATTLSDGERAAMGVRGRRWVGERFGWARIGEEMRAVYDWILKGGTVPASVHHV